MRKTVRLSFSALGLATVVLFAGCGKKANDSAVSRTTNSETSTPTLPSPVKPKPGERDNTKEVQDFYASKPDFFKFKSKADLPANLTWETGQDLPDIGSAEAKKGGTMFFFIPDYPRTLRTVGPDSNGSFRPWILDDVAMRLAQRHPNDTSLGKNGFHYFPGIAEAWSLDRENKTVYVKINPKARWSDGQPITSDDFIFAFFFYQSKYIQAPWYNNYYSTKFTGITRYDEHTFAFHVPEVRPDVYATTLENEPVPRHFYYELGDDFPERYQWRFIPTSGAYVVDDKDLDKGRSVTIARNKEWWARDLKFWRHRFNVDRIRLSVIRDTAKAFEAFKKGELDLFGLQLAEYWYDKLPDNDADVTKGYIHKFRFYNDVPRPTYGLWINQSVHLLDNRDIRIGINYATNWELVIEKFARGDWARMQTSSDGYGEFTHPTLRSRVFSIDNALASFAKAGFTKRGPDGVLQNDRGERLSFQITTGYEPLKDVLTILREEGLKAGVEFRVEVVDGTTAWKKIQEKKHEICFSAFGVSPEMFPRYWETLHSANAYDQAFLPDGTPNPDRKVKVQTNNLTEIAEREIDTLVDRYDRETSIEELKKLAFRIEELVHENAAFCPGYLVPQLRSGHWRWLRFPDDGNVKIATTTVEYNVHWIDEAARKETMDARKSGKSFPPSIKTYEQFLKR